MLTGVRVVPESVSADRSACMTESVSADRSVCVVTESVNADRSACSDRECEC